MAQNIVVQIQVQTSGAQHNVGALTNRLEALDRTLRRIRHLTNIAFGFVGIGAGIRGITNLADEFINLENRIRVVTTGQKDLTDTTQKLYEISQRTRASFSGTTEIFARTAVAARGLGVSNDQLLKSTETLNKAIILSGAGSIEARAALIQLSQGIASGTLRGEELRSVLEQLPVVADLVANRLGVARGNLIRIGKEGKITTQIILEALKQGEADIDEQFKKTIPTIAQGLQILRNSLIKIFGEFNNATGTFSKIARLLIWLSENIKIVARLFLAAGTAISIYFVGRGLNAAIDATLKFGKLLFDGKHKMMAFGGALGIATGLLVAFADQIYLTEDGMITLQDLGLAVAQTIGEAFGNLAGLFEDDFVGPMQESGHEASSNIVLFFLAVLQAMAQIIDKIVGYWTGVWGAIIFGAQKLPKALADLFYKAVNGALGAIEWLVNKSIDGINTIRKVLGQPLIEHVELTRLDNKAEGGIRDLAYTVTDVFMEGLTSSNLEDAVLGLVDKSAENAAKRLHVKREQVKPRTDIPVVPDAGKDKNKLAEYLQGLREEITLLRLVGREREIQAALFEAQDAKNASLTASEAALVESLKSQVLELQTLSDVYEQIKGEQRELGYQLKALNQLLAVGKISVEEYTTALLGMNYQMLSFELDAASGFKRGLIGLHMEIRDVATTVETTLVNSFHSVQDAIVELVTTGKFSFTDLVNSILADLTRLLMQQLLLKLITSFASPLGGANAMFGDMSFNPRSVAQGGTFEVGGSGGTDSQLVSFMATPGERFDVTPPGQTPQEAAPPPQVTLKNVNILDPGLLVDALSTSSGEKAVVNVIRRNSNQLKKVLS